MTPEFWRGKRVFLTGHTGFKGSWLAIWLARHGAQVRGYALDPPTQPSLFELAAVGGLVDSVIGDIRDRERVADELRSFLPEIVLHFAAQSVVLRSYEDPIDTITSNVVGTANVLDGIRRLGTACTVVNVTTDKVYENRNWVWGYRERDRLGGRDPYSASKACAEFVARAFRDSFFSGEGRAPVGLASARAGNVIGGGDWTARQLVPETVQALAEGRPVMLRHPEAVRPWQHVLDCLNGYLMLAEALDAEPDRYAGEWNFGPTDADMQPVARVVETLAASWGARSAWRKDGGVHPHEERELRLNSQKSNRELGWMPRLSLDHALRWTAEWYRSHASGADARSLCVEQIDQFMAAK